MMSPWRARTGGAGGVPSGVSAGSLGAAGSFVFRDLSSFMTLVPDARVKECVRDVNQQVEYQNGYGYESHNADYQRLVPVETSVDEIVSQAGQCENLFDDNRACD